MNNGHKADYQRMFQEIVFGDIRNANISNISSLLKQGVDPNIYNKKGLHPLWRAAYHNRSDFVELLVQYGAVVDLPTNNKFGDTALIGAAQEGYVECATILLKYRANVNYLSKKGCTALYYACRYGHANIVNLLLDKGANIDKGTFLPLYGASQGGLLAIVEVLVSRGAGIDKPCDTQIASTPLTIACGNNHLEVAHFLICKGANVNYQTKSGFSSLHFASQNGHRAVVQLLIKSQARLDIKDNDGDSPLDMARRHGHSEIVSLVERADHTIPSGHILTKQELQVLGALLVTYSDERLKSIQISLQEEQEIRDISREEVEKSLRQNGLTSIANALKDNIEKGVMNMKHYRAYEQALKGGLSLTLRYLKFLFFGPPRSGKTSTRRRLIKEIINLSQLGEPSISTGVAEANDIIIKKLTNIPEDITIIKLTSEPAAIVGSQWWSMKRSKEDTQLDMYGEGDLGYIVQLFYHLISRGSTSTTPASTIEPIPVQNSKEHSQSVAPDPSDSLTIPASTNNTTAENMKHDAQPKKEIELEILVRLSNTEKSEIDDAFKKLTTILQSDSPEDLKQLLEDLTMINMTDVGGQPAILDMLPALTIGPALYLLFFRLDQELGKKYPVRFHAADSENEVTLESSYCIEEVLYQCLASIACFSSQQRAERKAKPQASSRALLFGTYKDHVSNSEISIIENTMEERFKQTKLHQEGLLLKSLRGKMVTTVDNMFGTDESEMSDIRTDIERIIKSCFPATLIPASWLMFRIVLHLLNKPIVSLAQCEEIAKQLSMTSPVQEAIWFFHHDIGSLMRYSNIPSMKDAVICNPQVIFDSISKLIIDLP